MTTSSKASGAGARAREQREAGVYGSLALVLACLYAAAAVASPALRERFPTFGTMLFGFDQLQPLGWAAAGLPVLVAFALRLRWDRLAPLADRLQRSLEELGSRGRLTLALGVGAYSSTVFLGLRNGFVNPDGGAFSANFPVEVQRRGAVVTHDEMLELYVHSRFWRLTNEAFDWSVEFSYQFLSSLAGGVFMVLLLAFSWHLLSGRRWIVLVLGVASSGFMQLFFGDVENYTLVTTLILLYLLTGYLFLEGRVGLWMPSAVAAVAICFHLLAAFLLPSLAYLHWAALRRGRSWSVAGAAATLVVIPSAVVVYFHFNGLPLEEIRNSNAFGQAGKLQRFATPDPVYHGQILSLLFLLFPPLLCLVALIAYRRVALTPFNIFLSLAGLVALVYVFGWRADLGVYNDWNLFAPAALPLASLFWHNFARADTLFNKAGVGAALVLTSAFHSYAWIIRNHV